MSPSTTTSVAPPASLAPLVLPGGADSVADRWAAVVAARGEHPALTSRGATYTFAAADERSDAVAGLLDELLPADGTPVALLLDHGADQVVALLALMKAGRIAVPLDPHLPAERLRQILDLAGCTSCLVDAGHAAAAATLGVACAVRVDELGPGSGMGPAAPAGLTDPLCLVFTSGSTGRPKGVVYTHGQALNDALAGGAAFRIDPDDRVAQVLPLSFAAGLGLLWIALLNGAGVWLHDPRSDGTRGLGRWVADARPATLHCTPHLLRSLLATLRPGDVLASLRLVCTVGEAVHGRDYEALHPHLPAGASFVNWTGSSEIGALSFHEIRDGDPVPPGAVPAGRPVAHRDVLIVRDDGTVADPGEAGALHVVSDYLSGGYWGDGETGRFGIHTDGRRVCRQGDLARLDGDGVLHLLGRQDAAVKVRGYLVDTGEVEAAILESDAVAETVVVAVAEPPAPTRLVAYVVPDPRVRAESVGALRRRLRARLPEYMVPAAVVQLPGLPRNERGKVDRQQLPAPDGPGAHTPPATQWEIVMADLWAEILGLEQVGRDDDFLALGGDSLSVEEMLVQVAERFGVALVTSDLVEAPTLQQFTHRVRLGSAALPSHPTAVALRAGGTQRPVFCFAGGGALTLSFLPVARHLDDRPVYAFQAHGLERRALPDRSVEAAARRALELLRVIQPRGPYVLLGHSFGGLVALEIARRLTEAGEEVELLGLLDTYQPGADPYDPRAQPRPTEPAGPLGRLRSTVERHVRRALTEGPPGPERWAHHARIRLAGLVPFSGQHQFDAFFEHARRIGARYRLRPYSGRALLVLADNNPDGAQAWRPFLTGPTRVVELPAEHSSLMREPYATRIADLLAAELAG